MSDLVAPSTFDSIIAFARAAHDAYAYQTGKKKRWDAIKDERRHRFLDATIVAAQRAHRSQFSPLAGERLPNPPNMRRVFFVTFAGVVDGPDALKTPKRVDCWQAALSKAVDTVTLDAAMAAANAQPLQLSYQPASLVHLEVEACEILREDP